MQILLKWFPSPSRKQRCDACGNVLYVGGKVTLTIGIGLNEICEKCFYELRRRLNDFQLND